ncbi:hydantoinase B/oxoprolinase family protein [Bacillus sp. SL00103]
MVQLSAMLGLLFVSDVGGLVPSSISPTATDVHQEGLRIPPVKIYDGGIENQVVRTF